ncbi:MAG: hypothetical protein IKI22_03730 [Neisseriaceae bacterium]|nr:hypothetical protein [Neisseriaceae bacterium]
MTDFAKVSSISILKPLQRFQSAGKAFRQTFHNTYKKLLQLNDSKKNLY